MPDDPIYPNGVDGLTGDYLLAALSPAELATQVKRIADDAEEMQWLRHLSRTAQAATFALRFDLDPTDLASVGWAVVFSEAEEPAVREALSPLIEHRRAAAGDVRTKVLKHAMGESWRDWLARHCTAPGNLDPTKVPYYVLLVGPPDRIPFRFQYLLDVEYAVGRLDLDDPADYARYAEGIVKYERGGTGRRDATAAFFGTHHPFDGATRVSSESLVTRLAATFDEGGELSDAIPDWGVARLVGEPATKRTLAELLAGAGEIGRPALFFSATHGMGGWPAGDPDQRARHGALLCQDWPGTGRISPDHYFAASDLEADGGVQGLVAVFFACYGAGTPDVDAFSRIPGEAPKVIADQPFVAQLPKALLSAGALAAVGHVERAWGYSFLASGGPQLVPFQDAIGRMLLGQPVGHAMNAFNDRYASLSTNLLTLIDGVTRGGLLVPDEELARLWTERVDAQNYVVLGDPAARQAMG